MHCDFPSDLSLTSQSYFRPHSFTLCISKTDMQHSITLFSQARPSLSAFAHALLSEAASTKESRDVRRETS